MDPEAVIEQNKRLSDARERLKELVKKDTLFLTVVNQMRETIAKELGLPPSTMTRASGSVPENLTSTRPDDPSALSQALISCSTRRISVKGFFSRTRTLYRRCG